ncbi:uncharacterized protein MELLADRAFT_76379 [Melampsora larici-populina 98AG31]|uniref:AMP-dependent synthetase/ligase domain-containing protein n=1 Tax=Melampsora larici-populina (strain 98AG31 / pathotype 3-4-7) TaxID=747676 RepID=F4R4N6_MELLP|nr:uncharacterized protein MELLADRAFT_76379 [Melampsora larici-populina 98AG31]EGG12969.1 hypothetical protein MELLADRAFT_76379 [Melampsora larici-populina 98AG31]
MQQSMKVLPDHAQSNDRSACLTSPVIHRNASCKGRLIGPEEFGCTTLWDAFIRGYLLAGSSANCLGSRLPLEPTARSLPQASFNWQSYGKVYSKITISEYACYRSSLVVVSIDDLVSSRSASQILNQTKPKAIILPTEKLNKLIKVRAAEFAKQKKKLIRPLRLSSFPAGETSMNSELEKEMGLNHAIDPLDIGTIGIENVYAVDEHSHELSMLSDTTGSHSRFRQSSIRSLSETSTQAALRNQDILQEDLIYIVIDGEKLSKKVKMNCISLGVRIYTFEDVEKQGRIRSQELGQLCAGESSNLNLELTELKNTFKPTQETWAAILYSSGTTGPPKPAVITHGNFASNLAALHYLVKARKLPEMTCADLVQFSYLPLTHIYEKQSQAYVFYNGGSIGFSSILILRFLEDITILKPTLLTTTPNFLINQILSNRLNSLKNFESYKNSVESYLLNKAIEEKIKVLKEGHGEKVWLWDRFVLGYLRDRLGGRLKWIVSGTSALSAHATELLTASLSVRITEGYGLTETCSSACVSLLDDSNIFSVGHVGPPLPCCEIKIVDVPPIYSNQDQPFARGEIYIRGHNVFAGYFCPATYDVNESLDCKVDHEGWFATGDIGFFDQLDNLHIIDRLTPIQSMVKQQIHHHFHILNFQKIELSLLNSVKEIEQIFIASSSSSSGFQKDHHEDQSYESQESVGQIGALTGFVVVDVLDFLRWAETQSFLGYRLEGSKECESVTDEEDDDDDDDIEAGWETRMGLEEEEEEEEEELELDRFGFKLPINETDRESVAQQLCKDSKVLKAFLTRIRQKGKDAGLKSHELPVTIHLTTVRFSITSSQTSSLPLSEDLDKLSKKNPEESVMTLKLKSQALIHHFLNHS